MNRLIATIPQNEIGKFCRRWQIRELAIFGSALRDDFRPDSDVDIIVTFAAGAQWGLLSHVQMQQELSKLLGRNVDLISKRGLEHSQNWLRRQEILNTARVFFSQPEVVHA